MIDARVSTFEANRLAESRQAYIQQLDRQQRQFKQAERMAHIGSWRLSLDDLLMEWSEQVYAIHEIPSGDRLPLDGALAFYASGAREMVSAALAQCSETGRPFDIEADFVTAKGNKRRVRSKGDLELIDEKPVAIIGVFQDITAEHKLQQSLRYAAETDDLTQLPNRARCDVVLAERVSQALEDRASLALLLIDLDHFKSVNDLCGHSAGDAVLRFVGATLRADYLSKCFCARLGGDEFVVVVSDQEDCLNIETITSRDAVLLSLLGVVENGMCLDDRLDAGGDKRDQKYKENEQHE